MPLAPLDIIQSDVRDIREHVLMGVIYIEAQRGWRVLYAILLGLILWRVW